MCTGMWADTYENILLGLHMCGMLHVHHVFHAVSGTKLHVLQSGILGFEACVGAKGPRGVKDLMVRGFRALEV